MYEEFQARDTSQADRQELGINQTNKLEFTYGECIFDHFLPLLKMLEPQPGEIFWDLGCGGAKPNAIMALQYPELKASKGIEYLPNLAQLGRNAVAMLETLVKSENEHLPVEDHLKIAPLEILTGDLLECGW